MKYIHLNLLWALILLAPLYSDGQDLHTIFPNLNNQEALDSVIDQYKPTQVLSYSHARDYLYGTVYNENDTVECVYSGHKLHLPKGVDPSTHLFKDGSSDGINCEHTYPRSKGAAKENGNPYSDMHHLFPTRSQVNSGRENFPFTDIEDEESTHWYYQDEVRSFTPVDNINLYSERLNGWFEPREEHKGNAARAIFYFYTMYKAEADNADLDFFDTQKETLCKWNVQDPVDEAELLRTNLIAEMQDDLGNPFVLDQTLVDRCYCLKLLNNKNVDDKSNSSQIRLYPNLISKRQNLIVDSQIDHKVELSFFDAMGMNVLTSSVHLFEGVNEVDIDKMPVGNLFFMVTDVVRGNLIKKGFIHVVE